MSASAKAARGLVEELTQRGVTLEALPGGKLRYRPKAKLDAGDLERLAPCKSEVIRVVSEGRNISSPPSPPSPSAKTPDNYAENYGDGCGDTVTTTVTTTDDDEVPEFIRKAREHASKLGLVARWSKHFGFVSVHDPTTGLWHELRTEDAPGWAKREASKRKGLRKRRGETPPLTRAEMEGVRRSEQAGVWDRPAVTDRGIVYGDYLPPEEGD